MTYYTESPHLAPPRWRQAGLVLLVLFVHLALLQLLGRTSSLPKAMPPQPLSVRLVEASPDVVAVQPPPPPPPPPKKQPPPRAETPPKLEPKPLATKAPLLTSSSPSPVTVETPASVATPVAPAVNARAASEPAVVSREVATRPAAPAVPAPVVAARFDADYLQNPKPVYPRLSVRLGETGKVLLRVRVSHDGRPLQVDIETSSGFPRLDQAAHAAVTQWRFIPARQGETPLEATVLVPLSFALDQ